MVANMSLTSQASIYNNDSRPRNHFSDSVYDVFTALKAQVCDKQDSQFSACIAP
jgi:hypothetical protein